MATGDSAISILEVGKPELDRLSTNGMHQGIALQVPEFEYTHPDDLMAEAKASGTPPSAFDQFSATLMRPA